MKNKEFVTQLSNISTAELVRMSEANLIDAYSIGVDVRRVGALIKVRFTRGEELSFFASADIVDKTAKTIRRAARKHHWRDETLDQPLSLTPDDWDAKRAGPVRLECFQDQVIMVILIGKDLFQAARLPPPLALGIANILWEQLRQGRIQNARDMAPPSPSRN